MQAIVMHQFGGPEVLRWERIATPSLDRDDVLVRVGADSVNRTLDLAVREGKYPVRPSLPHILGVDPTGTVAAAGSEVASYREGDRVAIQAAIRCGQCERCRAGH